MFRAGNLLSLRNNLEFRSSARQSAGIQFSKFTAIAGWSQAVNVRALNEMSSNKRLFAAKIILH